MLKLNKKTVKIASGLALMVLMNSCTNKVGSEITITGCEAFSLIYPSRLDTDETKRQVLAHNLTYQEICHEEEKENH